MITLLLAITTVFASNGDLATVLNLLDRLNEVIESKYAEIEELRKSGRTSKITSINNELKDFYIPDKGKLEGIKKVLELAKENPESEKFQEALQKAIAENRKDFSASEIREAQLEKMKAPPQEIDLQHQRRVALDAENKMIVQALRESAKGTRSVQMGEVFDLSDMHTKTKDAINQMAKLRPESPVKKETMIERSQRVRKEKGGFVDFLSPPKTISSAEAEKIVRLSEAASIEEVATGSRVIRVLKIGGRVVAVVAGVVAAADTLKELEEVPLGEWPKKAPESAVYHFFVKPLEEIVRGFFSLGEVQKQKQAEKRLHESRKKRFIDDCISKSHLEYWKQYQRGEIIFENYQKIISDRERRRNLEQDCLKKFLLNQLNQRS